MPLPDVLVNRLHRENDVVALIFKVSDQTHLFPLRIDSLEAPNNLYEFSLGAATALATAGTGWSQIQDSSNNYHLQPPDEDVLYQVFYGISPSLARVYRRYPANVDRGSLNGTRVVGTDAIGYIDGQMSPLRYPSPVTELYTVKGIYPSFFGYHPRAEPSSITVRLSFYIYSFGVTYLKPSEVDPAKITHKVTMGGRTLMQAPSWLRDKTKEPV